MRDSRAILYLIHTFALESKLFCSYLVCDSKSRQWKMKKFILR